MPDPSNIIGSIVPPILGLAVAGFAVKTIGDMYHGTCHHCGATIKAKSHEYLTNRASIHSSKMHPQKSRSIFWD